MMRSPPTLTIACPRVSLVRNIGFREIYVGARRNSAGSSGVLLGREDRVRSLLTTFVQSPCA